MVRENVQSSREGKIELKDQQIKGEIVNELLTRNSAKAIVRDYAAG